MAQDQNPFSDLMKTFQQFSQMSWPGGDMPNLATAGTDSMQTMQEVARISSQALQQMMSRQQEMTAEAVSNWQNAIQQVAGANPDKMVGRVTELSREGAETAAKNFAELSQMANSAQTEIMSVIAGKAKK